MKRICSFLLLCAFAVGLATTLPTRTESPSSKRSMAAIAEGIPWNGGKGRGPFDVSSPQAGSVLPADREVPVEVFVRFREPCDALNVRVRGIDGVQILSRARAAFRECPEGQNLSHPIKVRLPAGTAGYLAVDVSYRREGQPHRETRAIALADARGLEKSDLLNQALTMEEQNGERLHIFQAESPEDDGGTVHSGESLRR